MGTLRVTIYIVHVPVADDVVYIGLYSLLNVGSCSAVVLHPCYARVYQYVILHDKSAVLVQYTYTFTYVYVHCYIIMVSFSPTHYFAMTAFLIFIFELFFFF